MWWQRQRLELYSCGLRKALHCWQHQKLRERHEQILPHSLEDRGPVNT